MQTTIDDIIKMEIVTPRNKLRLMWYVLIGRALSVGYLIPPDKFYKEA